MPKSLGSQIFDPSQSTALYILCRAKRSATSPTFFEYDYKDGRKPISYTGEVVRQVDVWNKIGGGQLVMRAGEESDLIIFEARQGRQPRQYALKACSERSTNGAKKFVRNRAS